MHDLRLNLVERFQDAPELAFRLQRSPCRRFDFSEFVRIERKDLIVLSQRRPLDDDSLDEKRLRVNGVHDYPVVTLIREPMKTATAIISRTVVMTDPVAIRGSRSNRKNR